MFEPLTKAEIMAGFRMSAAVRVLTDIATSLPKSTTLEEIVSRIPRLFNGLLVRFSRNAPNSLEEIHREVAGELRGLTEEATRLLAGSMDPDAGWFDDVRCSWPYDKAAATRSPPAAKPPVKEKGKKDPSQQVGSITERTSRIVGSDAAKTGLETLRRKGRVLSAALKPGGTPEGEQAAFLKDVHDALGPKFAEVTPTFKALQTLLGPDF